jgi:cytochrome bd-type quinol oxidase subunit 2
MKDQDNLKSGIDRLIPILGWITLIGIALFSGLLVLGMMTFAVWLAILFLIKILPIIIIVIVVLIIWKLLQDRKERASQVTSSDLPEQTEETD